VVTRVLPVARIPAIARVTVTQVSVEEAWDIPVAIWTLEVAALQAVPMVEGSS
jgi:hypothetical protein